MESNADASGSRKFTEKQAYLCRYYSDHKTEIRAKQKAGYEAKYTYASPELLEHLRANRTHALGSNACPDCERLGPVKAVVCLECGRAGLAQLAFHTRKQHELPIALYKEKYGYNAGASLTSAEFREDRSRLSSSGRNVRRLKSLAFDSARARAVNKGQRHRLRREALEARSRQPRTQASSTGLSRRLRRVELDDWAVTEQKLKGLENKQIAATLRVSSALVSKRCQQLGLTFRHGKGGSRSPYFWRGEPVGDRQLQLLIRRTNSTLEAVAKDLRVPLYRIRAARRIGETLNADIGRRISEKLAAVRKAEARLWPDERNEIGWKFRLLLLEIGALRRVMINNEEQPAAALCRLARTGQAKLLFRWGREFLPWLDAQIKGRQVILGDPRPHEYPTAPFEIARWFLAAQYKVSEETVRLLCRRPKKPAALTIQQRRRLDDLRAAFGEDEWLPSSELLQRLRRFGDWRWRAVRSPRQLADTVAPLGMQSQNVRQGDYVVKGYRRAERDAYSTREVAEKLDVALITLKGYIARGTVNAPPLVRRRGVRGRGTARIWTTADIEAARTALDRRTVKHRRVRQSAT